LDLNTLVSRLYERLWIIVLLTVIGAAAGFGASKLAAPVFQSEARVLVGQSLNSTQVDYSDLLASQLLAQTYADLATTTPVLTAAAKNLNPPTTGEALSPAVSARAPLNSIYVVIQAQASSGARAAAIANEVAKALVAQAPAASENGTAQEAIQRQITSVDAQIAQTLGQIAQLEGVADPNADQTSQLAAAKARVQTLQAQRSSIAAGLASPGSNMLSIVEPASPPVEAFQPRTLVNAALGAFIGFAIGVAIVLLTSTYRRREPVVSGRPIWPVSRD
jgi:capsular polysaccharide biosynthesis protein